MTGNIFKMVLWLESLTQGIERQDLVDTRLRIEQLMHEGHEQVDKHQFNPSEENPKICVECGRMKEIHDERFTHVFVPSETNPKKCAECGGPAVFATTKTKSGGHGHFYSQLSKYNRTLEKMIEIIDILRR